MSQQPYQPGQPGQPSSSGQPGPPGPPTAPGQPAGYPQPGQQGYPQGYPGQSGYGYQQQQQQPPRRPNALESAAGLAPILTVVGYVLPVLGIVGFIMALTVGKVNGADFYPITYKLLLGIVALILGGGLGALCLAAGASLRRHQP